MGLPDEYNGVAILSAHGLVRSHDVLGHMTCVSFVLCEFTAATTLPEGALLWLITEP